MRRTFGLWVRHEIFADFIYSTPVYLAYFHLKSFFFCCFVLFEYTPHRFVAKTQRKRNAYKERRSCFFLVLKMVSMFLVCLFFSFLPFGWETRKNGDKELGSSYMWTLTRMTFAYRFRCEQEISIAHFITRHDTFASWRRTMSIHNFGLRVSVHCGLRHLSFIFFRAVLTFVSFYSLFLFTLLRTQLLTLEMYFFLHNYTVIQLHKDRNFCFIYDFKKLFYFYIMNENYQSYRSELLWKRDRIETNDRVFIGAQDNSPCFGEVLYASDSSKFRKILKAEDDGCLMS